MQKEVCAGGRGLLFVKNGKNQKFKFINAPLFGMILEQEAVVLKSGGGLLRRQVRFSKGSRKRKEM